MIYVLVLLILVLIGVLVYLATLPGEYLVRRSLLMSVDRQAVFDKVRDLRSWKDWSPWLLHEPGTLLQFSDGASREGGSYTWNGQRVGAGKLTHVRFDGLNRIEQRIEFTRPFKSVCDVWWEFDDVNNQTEVTWCMRGRMPFLFRFMTNMTRMMIEKDYDLGLAMLRGQLDPNAERPVISFDGVIEREAQTVLTIPFKGGISSMVTAMERGFPALEYYVAEIGQRPVAPQFAAYYKVDTKSMYFECDMALPVAAETPAGEFERKELGGGRYFRVSVQGSYDFLESAWYSTMSHMRMYKLKQDKSRPTLEVYENDPRETRHSNDVRTTLYVPLR